MKRFKTIVLLLCLIFLSAHAQTEHVKFMGISLNGTIGQFQQKLQAKSIRYDQAASREVGPGSRIFEGVFAGENGTFHIYYDDKTKIVYRAKVVIRCINLQHANQLYDSLYERITQKYNVFIPIDGQTSDGYKKMNLGYPSSDKETLIGEIDLWVYDNTPNYEFPYAVFIDYWDFANQERHEKNINDDL